MTHMLVSDDGKPIGVVNMDEIQKAGTLLGYDLAAAADNPAELERIIGRALTTVGSASFGYVCAAALRFVVEDLLEPLIEVGEAHGHPIRARMADAALKAREDLS